MVDFSAEIFFRTARSGGSGGQNVNKVETMAEAWWHVFNSKAFSSDDKQLIAAKLASRMNKEGYLLVKCSETRSQLENKEIARKKLLDMVEKSLIRPRSRKASKPSKAAIEKRLDAKRRDGEKKAARKKFTGDQ